ncbi:high-affinity branched-chain amino acid transport ATP-binding protein LivG (plasmid) [Cupriavidus necator N-1]|uniref:High-affinity branched-chain amino acid transport ATP-binding protein LivG n=1 Tax=Cupriavidus necator (strain ATCC 43291 / DSM 13513 / CCUG 52238 / LMG 8453 / N-1) TaxID=1042878 RepID=F8GYM6_CUPNN|nr:ABC transporter ATP-binding protein [Cupriavidus necator]AEI82967.1 high-affinity branched-chain amino acid transport ATP-binding protein LivG [Cupriavidus necator N-1]MDX6008754.1 ABC transporter ATP-binding protein [Cupriavidus necator]
MTATILTTRGLGLDYGSFTAVGKVALDLKANTLHSLIGPNGAGKTSLFNIVSGRLPATRGTIEFEGKNITRSPAHGRVKLGMARSFQVTSLFPESTVLDNLRLAAMGYEAGRSLHFWSTWNKEASKHEIADKVLVELDLARYASMPVGALSHGTQRLVEIGMCLVARPMLLLLDEPMAGLGLADVPRVSELLLQLKASYTILLVEHNMHVVMGISDRITVMFQGNVIAEGSPDEIRQDANVKRVYLGSSV